MRAATITTTTAGIIAAAAAARKDIEKRSLFDEQSNASAFVEITRPRQMERESERVFAMNFAHGAFFLVFSITFRPHL